MLHYSYQEFSIVSNSVDYAPMHDFENLFDLYLADDLLAIYSWKTGKPQTKEDYKKIVDFIFENQEKADDIYMRICDDKSALLKIWFKRGKGFAKYKILKLN